MNFIAKLFSQKCNGFSVGAEITCEGASQSRCTKLLSKHGCEWVGRKCIKTSAPAGKKDPGSGCNNNNDCKSGYCNMNVDMDNFNGMCDTKQTCDNDQQQPPRCEKCINDNLQFPDCTKCKDGSKLNPPNCTECIQKLMNPKDNCQSHIPCEDIKDSGNCAYSQHAYGLCKWFNNKCIKPKQLGDPCKKNGECQSGVCHSKDFVNPYKCMKCSDVNVSTCELSPLLNGHGDVCQVTGKDLNKKCVPKK